MEQCDRVINSCSEFSFCMKSESELLDSLKFEINLKEEEKRAYLESISESNSKDFSETSILVSASECSKYESSTEGDSINATYPDDTPIDEDDSNFSCWTKFSLDSEFWDIDDLAENRPISYSDLKLNKKEIAGILSQRVVATSLSHLAQLPGHSQYVFTKLKLSSKGLVNVSILEKYKDLMYVDMSDNDIEEIGVFSKMIHLVYLDLRCNQITILDLEEAKPLYLTYLDVSHNRIESIPDLDCLWSLTHLDLSNNGITTISGLWSLRHLKFLNLSHNSIQIFDVRLFTMNVRNLDLSHNHMSEWSGDVDDLILAQTLLQLNISNNRLKTLEQLKIAYWLEELDVSYNCIADVQNLYYLSNLKRLNFLYIDGNKLWEMTDVRGLTIHLLPSLSTINSLSVTIAERMNAADLFSKNLVQQAFQIYSWLLAKRHTLEPLSYGMHPTLRIQPGLKNIVLLVGPPGSCKWEIIEKLSEKFPNYVRMGRLVTTRTLRGDHMKHVSLECFNYLIDSGQVVTYEFRLGAGFAFCWDELEKGADGQVVLVGLELSSALCLIWQGLRPTLILTLTKDKDLHLERLKELCWDSNSYQAAEKIFSDSFITEDDGNLAPKEREEVNLRSNGISDSGTEILPIRLSGQNNNSNKSMEGSDIKFIHIDKANNCPCKNGNISTEEKNNLYYEEYDKINTFNEKNENSPITTDFLEDILLDYHVEKPEAKRLNQSQSSDISICITEEEIVEEESIDEIYANNQLFIDSVIASRDEYIDIHHKMPGLFRYSVMTDNINQSQKKLAKIIQEVYHDEYITADKEYSYNPKKDPMYQDIVKKNIDHLLKRLSHGHTTTTLIPIAAEKDPLPNKTNFYFNK